MRRWALGLLLSSLAPSLAAGAPVPAGCKKGARIEGREVSGDAADRLRALPSTGRGARPGEYRLRDGRVLWQSVPGGEGTIYAPAAMVSLKAALVEEQRFRKVGEGVAFHPLRGLIDDGAGFGAAADALAKDLGRRLEHEGLAPSEAGVEALASRWRAGGCRVEASLYRELTAWVGQRLKDRLEAGAWSTRASDDTVEPLVSGSFKEQKREIAPWELAARLLGDDGATVAALVDEALAPPAAAPPAPVTAPALDGVRPTPAKPAAGVTPASDPGLPAR